MRAKDLMVEPAPGVYHHACLGQLTRTLLQSDTGAVLILDDDGRVLGIATDGDLFRRRHCDSLSLLECCLTRGGVEDTPCRCLGDVNGARVANIMSHPVISASEDAELVTVASLLLKHGIRRIPVTRDGQAVGMLGRREVLRALLCALPASAAPSPSSSPLSSPV